MAQCSSSSYLYRKGARAALLIGVMLAVVIAIVGCSKGTSGTKTSGTNGSSGSAASGGNQAKDISRLRTRDVKKGAGAKAKKGNALTVEYTGWLVDGTEFDSSKDSGKPLKFTLGSKEVIPGWDEGMVGMQVGGKRMISVPSAKGYGAKGTPDGKIPPNAGLIFQVELLKIE